MIRVMEVSKYFDEVPVLKGVTTSFEQGKTNLVIGQSGSGKTVLMKCLVGLMGCDKGSIYYDDLEFTSTDFAARQIIRQQIGMLFQGGALFDSLTVEENIIFPLDMFSNLVREEKRERANFCLKRVNLENTNHLYPSELSGGMKKRVAIARAISNSPKYLFCDEPNSGLDPRTAIIIDNLISEITREFNITTIINTHDMNSVMEIGDKVSFLYNGSLWWEGTREDILHTDNEELNQFVYATELMRILKKS
ncbi:MAG TPA: ATP-binding cassette domain-containing protein [Bacteroidales bacterium]|nr:ATP-binding cassette domain-containing protein [Bacteroidales bacterium]